jgi:hypothetical protein
MLFIDAVTIEMIFQLLRYFIDKVIDFFHEIWSGHYDILMIFSYDICPNPRGVVIL